MGQAFFTSAQAKEFGDGDLHGGDVDGDLRNLPDFIDFHLDRL